MMGKSTHFTGQPIYSQIIKLLNKEKIKKLSHQTAGSEAYVKRFDGYTSLISNAKRKMISNNF